MNFSSTVLGSIPPFSIFLESRYSRIIRARVDPSPPLLWLPPSWPTFQAISGSRRWCGSAWYEPLMRTYNYLVTGPTPAPSADLPNSLFITDNKWVLTPVPRVLVLFWMSPHPPITVQGWEKHEASVGESWDFSFNSTARLKDVLCWLLWRVCTRKTRVGNISFNPVSSSRPCANRPLLMKIY